jgi:hypothetical protein
MRVPGAAELLDIWEAGFSLPLARRVLLLLAAACPEAGPDEIAAWPVGQRDARLLELRERLFGSRLTLVAACPACGTQLESGFHMTDIRFDPQQPAAPTHTLRAAGYDVSFRVPASADLVALTGTADAATARSLLLARCVIAARNPQGRAVEPETLPAAVVAEVAAGMAGADPQADVRLDFTCPSCAHRWQTAFDIAAFLWDELLAWARRTLREVHALARAYGWREADVLALTPTRRRIYLELAGQ